MKKYIEVLFLYLLSPTNECGVQQFVESKMYLLFLCSLLVALKKKTSSALEIHRQSSASKYSTWKELLA